MTDSQNNSNPTPLDVARRILHASTHDAIRRLQCRFGDGVLTIAGQVPSYHQKQLVLVALNGIEGVDRVEVQVDVTSQRAL